MVSVRRRLVNRKCCFAHRAESGRGPWEYVAASVSVSAHFVCVCVLKQGDMVLLTLVTSGFFVIRFLFLSSLIIMKRTAFMQSRFIAITSNTVFTGSDHTHEMLWKVCRLPDTKR